jgi:hypothetical protein
MNARSVLQRFRDFAGLPVGGWTRWLDGDDAALDALVERPRNPHAPWLYDDLIATLPVEGPLAPEHRRVLRALGAIDARPGLQANLLPSVARWLGRRLRAAPPDARPLAEVVDAMALAPEAAVKLAGLCLGAERLDDAARRVLALDDAALAAACASGALNGVGVATLLARHAPQRLAALLGAGARHADLVRRAMLLIGAAVLPRGALHDADFGAAADPLGAIEHLAPARVAPFAERFARHGETLVRQRRLDPLAWTALRARVLDGAQTGNFRVDVDVVDGLTRLLPLPRNLDAAARRLLAWRFAGGVLHTPSVGQWAEDALRAEADGEDVVAELLDAMREAGLAQDAQRTFLMRQLSGAWGARGLNSLGRWLLARDDDEVRALALAQFGPNAWTNSLFALFAQRAPQRVPPLLDVLRAQAGTNWHRAQGLAEVMALYDAPGVDAFMLERGRMPLPPGDDGPQAHARLHARHARLGAYRFLAQRDRARHLDGAVAAAREAVATRTWLGGEAIQWLLRTFGSDARAELTDALVNGPEELAATLASHLLAAFGPNAPDAVEWHYRNPHAYVRLTALRRLIEAGTTTDDARAADVMAQLLADPAPAQQVQALDTAAAWDWAWTEPRAWELLASTSARTRLAAATKLAAHRAEDTWPRALALLAHKQAPARLGAIALLALLDANAAAERFEARLDVESSADVRDQLLLGVKDSWRRAGRRPTWTDVEKRVAQAKVGRALAPWLDVDALPALALQDGRVVPRDAVAWLLQRQARVKGVAPDLEAELLYAQVDRGTSGDFALALLDGFLAGGAQAEEGFVLTLVGMLGDERAVAPLVKAVHAWVKDKRGTFAEYGVRALALMDNDAALRAVDDLALRYAEKPKNVGEAAVAAFDDAVERLGVTADELRDRLVPWLGFPEDGSPWIVDVGGGKQLVVGVDDDFNATLADAKTRKAVKSVPKTAPDELRDLKRLLKESAALHSARLHNMMVVGARWTLARFRDTFLKHPLLVPFAHRLVWTTEPAGRTTFRVDADGAFVDAANARVELPDDATIGIAHPLVLDDATRAAWAAVLPTQPFAQLARPATQPNAEERDASAWHGVDGAEMPTRTMKGQTARLGWRRGDTTGGYVGTYWKAFPFADVVAHLSLDEMPVVLDMSATCTVRELRFHRAGVGDLRLGDVHPIAFSEAVADAYVLAGKPPPA